MTLAHELIEYFNHLDEAQRQRLVNYARILAQTPQIQGEAGASIVQAVGFFTAEALEEIEAAIEADCEGIDSRDWE